MLKVTLLCARHGGFFASFGYLVDTTLSEAVSKGVLNKPTEMLTSLLYELYA